MNSITTVDISLKSAAETETFGWRLGNLLRGGEVIDLKGDVGAGKTTFVRGLAKGLGCDERVTSPTFTVCKVYEGRLKLFHYDFYRVGDDFTIKNILSEAMDQKDTVTVCEWSKELTAPVLDKSIDLAITVVSDDERFIECNIPIQYDYLKEGVGRI